MNGVFLMGKMDWCHCIIVYMAIKGSDGRESVCDVCVCDACVCDVCVRIVCVCDGGGVWHVLRQIGPSVNLRK